METRSTNRRMCNELVHELCKEIPIVKTSERILLTAHKMYAYLAFRFSKKLVYRDTIEVLLNARKKVGITIYRVAQNEESEPIVVINQKQWDDEGRTTFELETNKFHVMIKSYYYHCKNDIHFNSDDLFVNAHLLYFLRLIAPLLQPIQLNLGYYASDDIRTDGHVRFLNTESDWIDSIGVFGHYFDSEPIYGVLRKYSRLEIHGRMGPVNVPKLVQLLTTDNDQPKKYLFLWNSDTHDDGLVLLIVELKKEFVRATNKCRFVAHLLDLWKPLDEFTLCNVLTGERLELRRKGTKVGWYIHALSRCDRLDANENDFAE